MDRKEALEEIDLHQYWLAMKRRWLPAVGVLGLVAGLATWVALSQEPVYRAQTELLFKTNRTSNLTGLGEELGQLEALTLQNSPLDTQVEIVRSIPVMQETIDSLQLKDEDGELLKPQELEARLAVEGIVGTDVLRISYESENPEETAIVLNKIADVFIRNNIQANRAEAAAARQFIAQQLPRTEQAVRRADSELRQFKEANGVVALEEEAKSAVEIIKNLEDQIALAQGQRAEMSARASRLSSQINLDSQQAVAFSRLSQSPGVRQVLDELQQTQQQLTVERTRYREGYPTIAGLERRVSALDTLLQDRIRQTVGNRPTNFGNLQLGELETTIIADLVRAEAEQQGLERRVAQLTATRQNYQQRMSVLPRLEQTQRELERRLEAAQTTYETLLTKLQEIQVAENQNIGNARVISAAQVPDTPIGSSKKLIIAAGLVAGTLLGIATALLLDLVDQSIKTLKQARERFGYTLLGVIPFYGKGLYSSSADGWLEASNSGAIARDTPQFIMSEAYQMLQANLKFLSSDKLLKTIVVTSSVSQEGKSEVSANLAAAIAQGGRRVLLVDADMRGPSQHHVWNLTNQAGLSNVLVDQAVLKDVIQEVLPGLWVLTAGVMPPNPLALLDSRRMTSLIEDLSNQFDVIIFDTPPLAGTADAAVIGKMADGILLIVRPGVVDSRSAIAAKEFLTKSQQNILGMVVNAVDTRNEPDSYFYYTSGYRSDKAESKPVVHVGGR